MFGYLQPDLEKLSEKDISVLYTYNCSVCREFAGYGAKFCLYSNFDFGFLNFLLHSILKQKSEHKENLCSLSVLKNGQIAEDSLSEKVMETATICFHFARKSKRKSDSEIKETAKEADKKCFKKVFPENKDLYYETEAFLKEFYENRKNKVTDLKTYCQPVGKIAENIARSFKLNKDARKLFYYVGCWICFMDALGGLKKDHKNKFYNPLSAKYNYQGNTEKFLRSFGKYMRKDYFYFCNNIKKYFNRIPEINNHLIKSVLTDAPFRFGKDYL